MQISYLKIIIKKKKKKKGKRTKVEEYKCKSGIEMRKINRLIMCLEDLMLKYVFEEFANYQINQLLVVVFKQIKV